MLDLKGKILHIATDEKFIDAAIYLFEKAYPSRNEYRIIVDDENFKLKYLKTLNIEIDFYIKSTFMNSQFEDDLVGSDIIIFHNIDVFKSLLINNNSILFKNKKIVWSFWGGEIYNNVYCDSKRYISALTKKSMSRYYRILNALEPVRKIKLYLQRNNHPQYQIIKAAKKVNIFMGIQEDYQKMKLDKIITDDVGFVNFSYYPIEYIGMKNELNVFEKPNILIGNSATSTNNHLDVFKILLKYNLSGKKLIVPLSYGDEKYKSLIVSAGYKYFGSTFDPVLDFMPLDQYNNKLSTCGIAIMNHYRQQAIGNIISLLSQGCKVYLSKFATSYPYFKRLGFFIYSVEDDLLTASFNNLKQEEALQNKLIVKHYFGEKNLIDNLVF